MKPTYNLAVNLPLPGGVLPRLREALANVPVDPELLGYPDPAGALSTRQSIARWLEYTGEHGYVDPELLTVTNGARQALSIALPLAVDGMNEAILVEQHTYQGIRHIALANGTRCVDVAVDQHGMRPDALLKAAKQSHAGTMYIQPTLQNPTNITMPLDRRLEIAYMADMLDILIIEGDVYSPLHRSGLEPLPPLAAIVPHRTLHAGGIGKILGPGLRVGWLLHPNKMMQALTTEVIETGEDGLPMLLSSLVARWMDDATALTLLKELATAMTARGHLARKIVGPNLVTSGASLHAWLPAPDAQGLEKRLLARGVRVAASKHFVGVRKKSAGIRLALGAEQDQQRLEEALRIVAEESRPLRIVRPSSPAS